MALTASPLVNAGLLCALPAHNGLSTPAASSSKLRIARDPFTRIRQAVRDNNVTLLQRLSHQDLRNTDRNRLTSLSWAAVDGSLEVFEWLLLDYGHDDQELSRDSDNNTLLHLLASIPISPSPSSVPYSVPSSASFPPLPPLAPAVRSRISQSMLGLYHAMFPFLLDWSNSGGKTALHVASQSGNADLVSLLLERGADGELTDLQGNTPLHYAAAWGHEAAAEALMREGEAMWTSRNAEGFMPGDYAWSEGARQRLGGVWEDEVRRRRAQREEEDREREREEREYEEEMRRLHIHDAEAVAYGGDREHQASFDFSAPRHVTDHDNDPIQGDDIVYDSHRRRASKQFDPSSMPFPARSSVPTHAHWQSRIPLPARADSLQSIQPSPQGGRPAARYSSDDYPGPFGSEWLESPNPEAVSPRPGHQPIRPTLTQRDSNSSGPSFTGYSTPRWDVSPGLGLGPGSSGQSSGTADDGPGPFSPQLARMAPPSAPSGSSRARPTMHHRRSSSMAQALGPGVTLAPPLSHLSIEQQASGQAPLPALKYAEEEDEEDMAVETSEEVDSPVSYMSRPPDQRSPDEVGHSRQAQQVLPGGSNAKQDWPGQHALKVDPQSAAQLGSTPSRGTAAGPPVW